MYSFKGCESDGIRVDGDGFDAGAGHGESDCPRDGCGVVGCEYGVGVPLGIASVVSERAMLFVEVERGV